MSAWLLSKSEIDILVHWMFKMGTVQKRTNPDALGKTLWAANYRSIRARYGDYDYEGTSSVPSTATLPPRKSITRLTWIRLSRWFTTMITRPVSLAGMTSRVPRC
jgi:hypothetical protein